MFDSRNEVTATDIARSMKRLGFLQQEIYDTLTGTGISGGEVQLLLDRIEDEFEDVELESRVSRLAEEVEKIFGLKMEKLKIELNSRLRVLNRNVGEMSSDLESLNSRIIELQGICPETSADG